MVRVEVPAHEAEVAADLLWAAGASAVGESDPGPGGSIVLTADLDACPPLVAERWTCRVEEDDGAWWDGWRAFARAARAGRFVVRPPWVPPDTPAGAAIELLVDPGRSFGTGSHPSTLLALEVVSQRCGRASSVLDVGCGSGILAIGAALLGAGPVVAVDVDPFALDATAANATANGVAGVMEVSSRPVTEVDGTFGLVLANLGSPLVVDLAATLSARVGSGGVLVLSGLLEHRWEHVLAAYPGFRLVEAPVREGWRALVLAPASG